MPPRDLTQKRALIACGNPIEAIDVSEYLVTQGWASSNICKTGAEAIIELLDPTQGYALLIIALPPSDADAARLATLGVEAGCRVLVIDLKSTIPAHGGDIAFVSRPFADADLNAALGALGVAKT